MAVVNFPLPETDYRVQHPRLRPGTRVLFATPSQPAGVSDDDYVCMRFSEGISSRDFLSFVALARELRRRRRQLDIVHLYSTKLILFGPVVAALAGVPCVITVTGFGRLFNDDLPHYRPARVVYRLMFRGAVRLSRVVLFQNCGDLEATGTWCRGVVEKGRYIGSATTRVPDAAPKAEGGRLRVMHVARLLPSKGIADFIEVARRLHDDVDFVLVGGTSHSYPELAEAVRSAESAGFLTYRGRLDGDELAKEYDTSHVLFFPSYGEGMARVMLEAGMRHLCPVAYDIPANRDLVATGQGFLLPVGAVDEATGVITRLASERETVRRAASAYHDHICEEFSMERFAERLDHVLDEVSPR
ncbi:MAG TPA: glycosyltransferase [Acidimicrobiales bacterium]|nr:glycosyltransferase [Acidimicrobiales bacterium]